MERLIDNALIYGGLIRVNQPHLIERYNQALAGFGLPATPRVGATCKLRRTNSTKC